MDPSEEPAPPAVTVLGVSCDFHDAAACLVVDGTIVAAAEEERFSRRKHDPSLPSRAVAACLATAGLSAADVEVIAFYEKPLNMLDRFVSTKRRQGLRGFGSFVRDTPTLVGRNLMIGKRLGDMMADLGAGRSIPVRYLDHHRSHAAAAFLPSPFEHAAILTVDGIGEWATASIGRGSRHHLEILEELRYPDSLGLVYSFVTAYCGFRANSDEYKVMGLAPYGRPRFIDALTDLAGVNADGSVEVRADRLRWFTDSVLRRPALHRELGGPPRRPGEPLGDREADLAASLQLLTETALLRMAEHAHELTGETRLTMAGGVALNCVANGRILRESPFDELWVQPAAGDAGSAVGAALGWWHDVAGNRRRVVSPDAMSGAFLGPRVLADEVERWVERLGIECEAHDDLDAVADAAARRLADGQVIGWFQGRMEFGPRALGHRSILADPRDPEVRHRVNSLVKQREEFRPFAPAVLAEHAPSWFDLDVPSPYMLLVTTIAAARRVDVESEPAGIEERSRLPRSTVPACTHIDGTARVQTVDAATNPEFHALLSAFHRLTGCPVLLNTSFNVAGEPIVATPDEALLTARAGDLDALVVERHLIDAATWRNERSEPATAGSRPAP